MTTKEEALEAFLNGSPTHQERLRRGICVHPLERALVGKRLADH